MRRSPSGQGRSRLPLLLFGLAALPLLAACASQGPGASAPRPASSAALVPLSNPDLAVPPGMIMPPGGERELQRMHFEEQERQRAAEVSARSEPAAAPATPTGPQVRVTWEALAVEKERFENPRDPRSDPRYRVGLAMQQKVVMVNASNVEARANQLGVTAKRDRGVSVATIPDADMQTFLQQLDQRGFFRVASPTDEVESLFSSPNARGRVTVERDGRSWTLLSMRGQGLNASTKEIPAVYSDSKRAVILMRNSTSAMSVVGLQGAVLSR